MKINYLLPDDAPVDVPEPNCASIHASALAFAASSAFCCSHVSHALNSACLSSFAIPSSCNAAVLFLSINSLNAPVD